MSGSATLTTVTSSSSMNVAIETEEEGPPFALHGAHPSEPGVLGLRQTARWPNFSRIRW